MACSINYNKDGRAFVVEGGVPSKTFDTLLERLGDEGDALNIYSTQFTDSFKKLGIKTPDADTLIRFAQNNTPKEKLSHKDITSIFSDILMSGHTSIKSYIEDFKTVFMDKNGLFRLDPSKLVGSVFVGAGVGNTKNGAKGLFKYYNKLLALSVGNITLPNEEGVVVGDANTFSTAGFNLVSGFNNMSDVRSTFGGIVPAVRGFTNNASNLVRIGGIQDTLDRLNVFVSIKAPLGAANFKLLHDEVNGALRRHNIPLTVDGRTFEDIVATFIRPLEGLLTGKYTSREVGELWFNNIPQAVHGRSGGSHIKELAPTRAAGSLLDYGLLKLNDTGYRVTKYASLKNNEARRQSIEADYNTRNGEGSFSKFKGGLKIQSPGMTLDEMYYEAVLVLEGAEYRYKPSMSLEEFAGLSTTLEELDSGVESRIYNSMLESFANNPESYPMFWGNFTFYNGNLVLRDNSATVKAVVKAILPTLPNYKEVAAVILSSKDMDTRNLVDTPSVVQRYEVTKGQEAEYYKNFPDALEEYSGELLSTGKVVSTAQVFTKIGGTMYVKVGDSYEELTPYNSNKIVYASSNIGAEIFEEPTLEDSVVANSESDLSRTCL